MMQVFSTYITISRPMGDHPGAIEPGHFIIDGDEVTLTNDEGQPLVSGRLQSGYTAKIGAEETPAQVANRLLLRKYRATKGGSDFNRPLIFPKEGWR